jgi:hypothetical protein
VSPICGLPFFSVTFYWLDGLYFVISISMGIPQLELWNEENPKHRAFETTE